MSHTAPKTLSDYRKDIDSALEDSFLRRTLDTFAARWPARERPQKRRGEAKSPFARAIS